MLGPKGGTGKTLTATNLAVALQGAGERVALVDLDLQFGDVGLCLGLRPGKTIHDLATRTTAARRRRRFAPRWSTHESGVHALLAPSRPDHASHVTVELIREIYTLLRDEYDAVVVDTPPGFTPEVIASIDMATDLVMVGMLDSLSLKNTKLGLETLELMGIEADTVSLVLNRAHSRVGISDGDVEAVLGTKPDVLVPSDREIPRAVNEGRPIVTVDPQSDGRRGVPAARGLLPQRRGSARVHRRRQRPTAAGSRSSEGREHRWSSTSASRPPGPCRRPGSSRTPS